MTRINKTGLPNQLSGIVDKYRQQAGLGKPAGAPRAVSPGRLSLGQALRTLDVIRQGSPLEIVFETVIPAISHRLLELPEEQQDEMLKTLFEHGSKILKENESQAALYFNEIHAELSLEENWVFLREERGLPALLDAVYTRFFQKDPVPLLFLRGRYKHTLPPIDVARFSKVKEPTVPCRYLPITIGGREGGVRTDDNRLLSILIDKLPADQRQWPDADTAISQIRSVLEAVKYDTTTSSLMDCVGEIRECPGDQILLSRNNNLASGALNTIVSFHYISQNLSQGFPGKLSLSALFDALNGEDIKIGYPAGETSAYDFSDIEAIGRSIGEFDAGGNATMFYPSQFRLELSPMKQVYFANSEGSFRRVEIEKKSATIGQTDQVALWSDSKRRLSRVLFPLRGGQTYLVVNWNRWDYKFGGAIRILPDIGTNLRNFMAMLRLMKFQEKEETTLEKFTHVVRSSYFADNGNRLESHGYPLRDSALYAAYRLARLIDPSPRFDYFDHGFFNFNLNNRTVNCGMR